jgi:5-methylcytosine-specific restriction endonuclease McrA
VIAAGSRCSDCQLERKPAKHRIGRTATDRRWRNLSQRLRRASPVCEQCGSPDDLTVDHIIGLTEAPELAHEPLNCRVLCRSHNAQRNDSCTDAEREAVYAAIQARKERQASFYLRELDAEQRNNSLPF